MTRYRLPRSQRLLAPDTSIMWSGQTLHRFNLSTSGNPAYKWYPENQLVIEEESSMNKYAKSDVITIGDMTAIYDSYTKDKATGEITTHYLRVQDDDTAHLTVSAKQMRNLPEAEAFAVGVKVKHERVEKPITEVRFPFYKVVWQSSEHNTSAQWLHHDTVATLLIDAPKPEKIAQPEAPDIEKALHIEMLGKIEALKAQLDAQSAELAKATMHNEQLERELKKAKNNVAPIGEVDAIRAERDSLRSQVVELDVVRKERDQLRSQLAVLAQEKPQEAVSDAFAIVRNESPAGMAKRCKQGFKPIHMQFEGGNLNVVYQRDEEAHRLPARDYTAITIPVRQPDYASALNESYEPDQISAIGNTAIAQAGASVWYGGKKS